MKHFEKELPAGYREVRTIDAKNTRTVVWLNIAAVLLMAAVAVPLIFLILKSEGGKIQDEGVIIPPAVLFVLCGTMLVYVVMHELVHGAAYYLLTRQRLTFGFSLTIAFCGVPEIYVKRKAALIALLAPFVVFDAVFAAGILFLPTVLWKMAAAVMLGIHVGGCVGDLYDTILLLFKFRGNVLIRDTGPVQTIYSDTPDDHA